MISKRHTLQHPAPGTRNPTQLLRNIMLKSNILSNTQRLGLAIPHNFYATLCSKVLHHPRLTKTTTTTLHPNNIKLKAALTLTPDNCRTN
ncbi:hypothetical protein HBI46_013850 [Parastagonospora nodorum]|nr:hypothetical protein HBI46_013850 [Parastagonospora nodorum]